MRLLNRCNPRKLVLILSVGIAAFAPLAASAAKAPSAGAQMEFGVQMAKRGLWSEALFRFKQAEKLQPDDAKTLNNLAVAYEAVGQFEEALEYYQKALRASPSSRDLKKNYSRFVEFYQGFKPEGEEPAADGTSSDEGSETGRA